MFKRSNCYRYCFYIIFFAFGFIGGIYFSGFHAEIWNVKLKKVYHNNSDKIQIYPEIDRYASLIFIGGWPRSGTTLMRIILDVNQDVRCGPETKIIPRILDLHNNIINQKGFLLRSPTSLTTLEAATTSYILEVVRRNGESAMRLCNKDPMAFIYLSNLVKFFPNAKFILMVRDGRAVTHSIYKRGITIKRVNNSDPWNILEHWGAGTKIMHEDCLRIGFNHCIIVKYENLILRPKFWINYITNFLGISNDEKMYSHWKYLKSENVLLNIFERSTDQVVKPISTHTLHEWIYDKKLSNEFITKAHLKAPMLKVLNYDISKIPPDYGPSESLTTN